MSTNPLSNQSAQNLFALRSMVSLKATIKAPVTGPGLYKIPEPIVPKPTSITPVAGKSTGPIEKPTVAVNPTPVSTAADTPSVARTAPVWKGLVQAPIVHYDPATTYGASGTSKALLDQPISVYPVDELA